MENFVTPVCVVIQLRSKSHCDWRSVSQLSLGVEPHKIFITIWQLRSCFCGAPSLTRRRVCLLHMLLALASAVFLGTESLGTSDRILLSQIWDFPFRRLLRLAGSRWRYSTPLPYGLVCYTTEILVLVIYPRYGLYIKYLFHYCVVPRCRRNIVST
jgi:hypothetical protein